MQEQDIKTRNTSQESANITNVNEDIIVITLPSTIILKLQSIAAA